MNNKQIKAKLEELKEAGISYSIEDLEADKMHYIEIYEENIEE